MSVTIKRPLSGESLWTADRTIYLDKDGAVVEYGPAAVTKLVHQGGQLPMAEAIRLGLVKGGATEAAAAPESGSSEPEAVGASDETLQSPDTSEDLESLKVAELRELAEREDVDLAGVTLKADIIAAIDAKRAA